jgi:hypothetical protein
VGVDNSGIDTFADAGIRISVGHIWLLSVLFQLACGTRRGRNPGTKKARRFRRARGLVWGLLFHGFLLGLLLENPAGTRRTGKSEK